MESGILETEGNSDRVVNESGNYRTCVTGIITDERIRI